MKIIGLQAQNVLNLKAVEINADGKSVVLTGKNGAGKSAVLDSIFMALTGQKCERPIRNGEEKGQVVVTLDEIVVTKTWTAAGGASLKVTPRDGQSVYASPQALLNKILGDLSFNPIEFSELGKTEKGRKEQREILMRLAKLDFTAEDKKAEELYTQRKDKNREIERLDAVIQSSPALEAGLPEAEISMADELAVVGKLEEQRQKFLDYQEAQDAAQADMSAWSRDILESMEQIKALQERIKTLQDRLAEREKAAKDMVKPIEVTEEQIKAAKESLTTIEGKNARIRANRDRKDREGELAALKAETEKLNKAIDATRKAKLDKIKAAKYPLEGLSVDDDGVLFKGVPISQLSSGQRLQVSTAIAMALNPKLRVILVRDASLLDKEGLALITKLAADNDYQLFVEKMDESGKVGVFIEAGEVKAVEGKAVKNDKAA